METRINIAEILRNKPHGIRLYSPIFGNCTFCYIKDETSDICVKRQYNEMSYFNFEGLYNTAGECLLFPSKEMHNWNKFAWKKGDVLTNSSGFQIFFDKWLNEDYTEFLGKIKLLGDSHCYDTAYYTLVSEEEALEFIKSVEEINNGKLNRETLEIEKAQPEFKDGDIIVTAGAPYLYYSKCIIILKGDLYTKDNKAHSYAFYNINNKFIDFDIIDTRIRDREIRLATDSEKLQLFDMLTKEGKYWDAEKKQIVDLKSKWTPKPFDRVITRDDDDDVWIANIFSHMDSHGRYVPIGCVSGYLYCIPYNEETAKLIGTTDDWEE